MRRLARWTFWYFPPVRADEILADYTEYFDEGLALGKTEDALCAGFGAPRDLAETLWRESSSPILPVGISLFRRILLLPISAALIYVSLHFQFLDLDSAPLAGRAIFLLLPLVQLLFLYRDALPDANRKLPLAVLRGVTLACSAAVILMSIWVSAHLDQTIALIARINPDYTHFVFDIPSLFAVCLQGVTWGCSLLRTPCRKRLPLLFFDSGLLFTLLLVHSVYHSYDNPDSILHAFLNALTYVQEGIFWALICGVILHLLERRRMRGQSTAKGRA